MQNTMRRICRVRDPARQAIRVGLACMAALLAPLALPRFAIAHGVTTPNASSYIAKVGRAPVGVQAKVIDGDLRMWMRVTSRQTVEVLDYSGAPYLRFSRSGVEVNRNSAIYYLNLVPVEAPPAGLTAKTPPSWQKVSDGDEYGWHDGRLAALASTVLAPGASYVGRWSIALRVDGRLSSISGGVWHAPDPPIAWFWPAIVIFACVLAAYRLRRPALDMEIARVLAVAVLASIMIGALARQLEGRPTITAWQIGLLVAILALVAAGLAWTIRGRPGCFFLFVVCVASLWEDFELIPTLIHGYVLMAMPALPIRIAAVACLGAGAALLLLVVRLADLPEGTLALPRRARRGSPA
jgi:hypothetical protein